MGPSEWLATFWTPAIEYRAYPANEVEDIACESTTTGSKRGFLVRFPAGALFILLLLVGVVTSGLYRPSTPTTAPRPGRPDATASQALSQELTTLRDEKQALKKQLMAATAAATCPPCQPQAVGKAQPPAPAVASPPQPSKQAMPRAAARRPASVPVPYDEVPQPIPSNCRQDGVCP
jgi:hypothetical protein